MAQTTKRRIRAIAIFVIFIALAYAGYSTFFNRGPSAADPQYAFREANAHFRDTGSLNKAKVIVHSADITKGIQAVQGIIRGYAQDDPVYSDLKASQGAFMFRVARAGLAEVTRELAAVGTIEERNEQVDTLYVTRNLATEEAILASKKNELAAMDSSVRTYGSMADTKNKLIDEIRQLEKTVDILRQTDSALLYVQLVSSAPAVHKVSLLLSFVKKFALALLVLFVATVLVYYGVKLMMYLLGLLGVRGFTPTGVASGSQYPYGNYSGRYYSHHGYGSRRKVKRIYKGKPTTPIQDGDSQPEQK